VKDRQRRKREGGVIDRRFGENDDDMDPEEKMLERFAREKQVQSSRRQRLIVETLKELLTIQSRGRCSTNAFRTVSCRNGRFRPE
jgi:hypothetical protein